MSTIPFMQARWFTKVGPSRAKDVIVLHSAEAPNKPDTAEGVGAFFQRLPASNKASAHIGCDSNSRVRYVQDNDVAFAAPGANSRGLHIELAGYARYNVKEWTQPQMMLMLQQAAQQLKEWMDAYKIPPVFLRAADLRNATSRGVTTHYEVSQAFKKSDHWDPGTGFPINTLLAMATSGELPAAEQEEEMPAYFHVNDPTSDGYWLIKPTDGGVFAFKGAKSFGSMAGKKMAAPVVAFEPFIVDGAVKGYWLLGADGGVFTFGDAPFTDSYAGHPEWHKGSRTFSGISQNAGGGYTLIAYENESDPPKPNEYDLTVKR